MYMLIHNVLFNLQISSLAIENKILVVRLKQTHKDPSLGTNDFDIDNGFSARETKEEVSETSASKQEVNTVEYVKMIFS